MTTKIIIKPNSYHDSVTLMAISGKVKAVPGVTEAVVNMATGMNKELMQAIGLFSAAAATAGPDDLLIAIRADSAAACEQAALAAEDFLAQRGRRQTGSRRVRPASIASAVQQQPAANLAVISVPGAYAAREALAALQQGLHVMLFSDNVSLAEEKKLKQFAHERGLLMMGPDCGTAIINGKGLCFANAVRRGSIGLVGASGTGTQEVTVQIDRLGGGISQALGTGGRDLTEEIGGIMMLDCLAALQADPATAVIVVISKPPSAPVAAAIIAALKTGGKPAVVCFLNHAGDAADEGGQLYFCSSLETTARQAVALSGLKVDAALAPPSTGPAKPLVLALGQHSIRGLFCGGTLCSEAAGIVAAALPAAGHRFLDLGDDEYTVGRPHPMIEPSLRNPHILEAAADPGVAVVLLDVVLGYGSHPDPAGVALTAIAAASDIAAAAGRTLTFVGYVCGTEQDPQNRSEQNRKLALAGVRLADSNAAAARLAVAIAAGKEA